MIFSKKPAIEIMNHWGCDEIPFLFIIDYEMKAIQLYRLDIKLPDDIQYSFHNLNKPEKPDFDVKFKKFPVPFEKYELAFMKVQKQIIAGNSFLTNLTFATPLETNLSLKQIYNFSHATYKILVNNKFVCFSPETFVTIQDGLITTRPMKGTINAALPMAESVLMESKKEIAEHNTVVDLLRNDLSIVADEVKVRRFRYVDRINSNEGTLLQVSSEITGRLSEGYKKKLGDIFFSLLPAGSVTGAPKNKTTSIIKKIELHERGYYTGVCGIFDGHNLDSAVMIRFIENINGKLYFKSGGGITFMSNVEDEYNELIDKIYVPIT